MKPVKTLHAVLVVLFGAAFLVPGLFLSGVYFRGFLQWWEARGWEEIPCRIEATELKSSRGEDSTTYQVTASYRYRYQGRVYQGDRVGFSSSSDNIGGFHQRAYRELSSYLAPRSGTVEVESSGPAVRSFRCYVNPDQPEDAVLYRELRWEMQAFMAIFALTFPAVGGGVVAFGWVSFVRLRRERRLQGIHPGEPWRWKPEWTGPAIPEASGKWRA
ncbi:MAG: DUF3592 domain-containing protein, partial [Akkermansiaceae bacterium]|nr:DUF3592 domain-containing protein [Akkermansiaceae bacterium]